MNVIELAKNLRNVGEKSAVGLIAAGIDTPEKLRKLGAKKAYLKIYETGHYCGTFHAAYIYALEGAITDTDWRKIPEKKKKEFKAFAEDLRTMK